MSYIHMEDLAERMFQSEHLVYAPREGGGAEVHLVRPDVGTYHLGVVLPGSWGMEPVKGSKVWWPDVAVPKGMDDDMDKLRHYAAQNPTEPCVVVIVP